MDNTQQNKRVCLLRPLTDEPILADAAIMRGLGGITRERNPDLVVFGDKRMYQGTAEWCRRKQFHTDDMLGKGSVQMLENRILDGIYSNHSLLVYIPLPYEHHQLEDLARGLKEYEIAAEVRVI